MPHPLLRAALVATALLAPLVPAVAGQAENALLERYAGEWSGKGKITGAEGGTLACRLTMRPASKGLSYRGRCALSGGSGAQRFSGTIQFNEASGRFESTSGSQTVAGKKSGNGVVFTSTQKDMRGQVTSTMSMTGGAIKVRFDVVSGRGGEKSSGSVSFSKG